MYSVRVKLEGEFWHHDCIMCSVMSKMAIGIKNELGEVYLNPLIHMYTYAATPNPPVITTVNLFNTSISLNWTHDRTCFERAPVKYHVLVNPGTQPVITDQLTLPLV